MRASDFEISNYNKLDKILSKLCDLVIKGQQSAKDYGMVAAAVVDPSNQIVARLNRPGKDGKRIHAEHAAMLDYTDKYGSIPAGSIIITTCSPCNEPMDERDGPSCTELINNSAVKKVYCGYMDPSQNSDTRQFNLMETADRELRNKCKQFADTFLDNVDETQSLEERRKKKRRVRRAIYGPGPYGWYGYDAGYSGSTSDGGGDGGGGESMKNEGMMGFLTKPIVKKPAVKPASPEEMRKYFEKEKAKDPDKIERGELNKQAQQVYTKRDENFADGKNPQDKGDSKRHGINTKASVSSLRKTAKQGGRKGQLAHWLANMKAGRAKKK